MGFTPQDVEAGNPEGVVCQRRSRDRCWGCTAGRVGEVIISNLYRFVLLGLIIALLILFSLKARPDWIYETGYNIEGTDIMRETTLSVCRLLF